MGGGCGGSVSPQAWLGTFSHLVGTCSDRVRDRLDRPLWMRDPHSGRILGERQRELEGKAGLILAGCYSSFVRSCYLGGGRVGEGQGQLVLLTSCSA